jgi:hypothetical protein
MNQDPATSRTGDIGDIPETASDIAVHCAHDRLVDITELVPNPRNPNKHPDKQVALLAKIIRHQGWRAPIVVSKRSGFIVAGHGRYEAAKLLLVATVPVNFQDFATEADEWAHLIADNRIAEFAETDQDVLNALVTELDGQIDLDLLAFDPAELSQVTDALTAPNEFSEYGEDIDTEYCCPRCGYKWSGKANSGSDEAKDASETDQATAE